MSVNPTKYNESNTNTIEWKNAAMNPPACHCDTWCERQHCALPLDVDQREEYQVCVDGCPISDEHHYECRRYCNWTTHNDISSPLVIVVVVCLAAVFGCLSFATSRLFSFHPAPAFGSAAFVALAALFIGLLPLTSRFPMICASVSWRSEFGAMIYPIVLVGAAGSFTSLSVSLAWLGTQPRTGLGMVALVYLGLVTVCNTCGVIGTLYMSCHYEHRTGLPFYTAWIVSSFITNLVLQKIVLMRAEMVDKVGLPAGLKCIFCMEVVIAFILFAGSMFIAIAVSTHTGEEDNHEEENERREDAVNWAHIIAGTVAFISLLFVVFDLIFSCISSIAMRNGLKKVRELKAVGSAPKMESPFGGLVIWSNALDRAIFFAKANVVLVVLSVSTTSLFYFAFMAELFSALFLPPTWLEQ